MSLEMMIYLAEVCEKVMIISIFNSVALFIFTVFRMVDKPVRYEYSKKITAVCGLLAVLFGLLFFAAPSTEVTDKIIAVSVGKELITKAPESLKQELSKLPVNLTKKLNEILTETEDE